MITTVKKYSERMHLLYKLLSLDGWDFKKN